MLNFPKNNIVVPQNATKATNATLCQNTLFWENRVGSHIPMAFRKYPDLMCPIFFGKGHGVYEQVPADIRPVLNPQNILRVPKWPKPTNENRKNAILSNVINIDLKGFRQRFLVQNASQTSQEAISGHTSSFRSLPASISKIEILEKIAIFPFFANFDFSQNDKS